MIYDLKYDIVNHHKRNYTLPCIQTLPHCMYRCLKTLRSCCVMEEITGVDDTQIFALDLQYE